MNRFLHVAPLLIAASVCVGVSSGCAGISTQPTGFGQPLELGIAQSATLPGGLKLTVTDVKADSRCPMDVMCVWAGDATVAVALSRGSGAAERELHLQQSGSETTYLGYSIKLIALSPYPRYQQPIPAGDYRATLTVSEQ